MNPIILLEISLSFQQGKLHANYRNNTSIENWNNSHINQYKSSSDKKDYKNSQLHDQMKDNEELKYDETNDCNE